LKASKANVGTSGSVARDEKRWLENLNDEDFGKYTM
jgi:hypothetical protein